VKIKIHLLTTSEPIEHIAVNAYTKGGLYCVLSLDNNSSRVVHKYPMCNIFRVIETYPKSDWAGLDPKE